MLNVNKESDCYILGLLSADGSCRLNKTKTLGDRYFDILELAESQIIYDISNYLNIPNYYRERIIANKLRKFYKITLNNDLIGDYGKYLIKGRPNIYELYNMCKYKNSYIRGWFDGDGCVSRFKNHSLLRLFFSINSQCKDLVKIYQEFIENNNFFSHNYFDKRGSGSWYMNIYRKEDIERFFYIIYSNNPILYLHRKYKIFTDYGFRDVVTHS